MHRSGSPTEGENGQGPGRGVLTLSFVVGF